MNKDFTADLTLLR